MTDAPLASQRGGMERQGAASRWLVGGGERHPPRGEAEARRLAQRSADTVEAIGNGETLVAGALAGLISEVVMHPLDTASLRAKVHPSSAYGTIAGSFKLIWQQEGLRGYFAGVSATVGSSLPSNAVYFTVYEASKNALNDASDHRMPSLVYFTSGALSEVAASLLVAPMEVVKARLQLGANPARATGGLVASATNFPSVPAALGGIYRERGLRGLVAGWNAGLLMDMSFSATQFLLYETLKARMAAAKAAKAAGGGGGEEPAPLLSTPETLGAGCVAGGFAAVLTNPLDVITSRLMIQAGGSAYGGGMLAVARRTLAEGPVALWRGTLPRAAQLAPMSALSFTVYEAVRRYLRLEGAAPPPPPGGEHSGGGGGLHAHPPAQPHVRHSVDMPAASAPRAQDAPRGAWGSGIAGSAPRRPRPAEEGCAPMIFAAAGGGGDGGGAWAPHAGVLLRDEGGRSGAAAGGEQPPGGGWWAGAVAGARRWLWEARGGSDRAVSL